MKIPRVFYMRLLQGALVIGLVLSVAGCFAPLGESSDGALAINASVPGEIFTQASQTFVARTYVANLDYEDLVRRFLAYEDFLDVNEELDTSGWQDYFDQLEEEKDDIDIDMALKAVIKFGGNPYVDVTISSTGVVGDTGSFTITGLPADRDYTVYMDVYRPGDEDDDDADNQAESELFTSGSTPWNEMFPNGDDPPNTGDPGVASSNTLAAAQTAFNNVLTEYTNTAKHPVISAFVEEGETATINLDLN